MSGQKSKRLFRKPGLLLALQVSHRAHWYQSRGRIAVLRQILHLATRQQIFFVRVTVGTKGRGGTHQLRQSCVITCSIFPLASFRECGLHPLSAFAGALQETPGWLAPSGACLLRLRGQGEEQGWWGCISPTVGLALLREAQVQVDWFKRC